MNELTLALSFVSALFLYLWAIGNHWNVWYLIIAGIVVSIVIWFVGEIYHQLVS